MGRPSEEITARGLTTRQAEALWAHAVRPGGVADERVLHAREGHQLAVIEQLGGKGLVEYTVSADGRSWRSVLTQAGYGVRAAHHRLSRAR